MTLFFTVSFPDLHTDLLKEILGITPADKLYREVKNNPHLADRFFNECLDNYIRIVFIESLGAKHYFIKTEHTFRHRIHAHGLLWNSDEPGPGLCALGEICKKGKIASLILENESELTEC